ncbi:MAG: TolC family outer membrane protein [Rhizobiales bacterium]|nr:TolC family outer membrane protein [Hyphomicrobiales bacterium]
MSLRDAVRHTVETNPTIAAARANRTASGYVLRQSQGRLVPTIDLSGDLLAQRVDKPRGLARAVNDITNYRRQVGVTVRQIMFDGFERANSIYRDAARLDAAALTVLQNSETVGLTAVEAYIDVRRHMVLVGIAQRNVRRHAEVLGLIRERAEGGKAPQSDVNQARERLLVARAVTEDVKRALEEAYAKFHEVVGLQARGIKRVRIPRSLPMTKRAAVKIAIANNPAIRSADANIDGVKFDRERAIGAYAPQIFAEGGASYGRRIDGTQGRSADVRGGVTFTWNLFSGLQRRNRLNEMDARVNAARYQRDAQTRAARGLAERAWAGLIRGRKRVSIIRQQVEINQSIVKSYQEEYELGKRSLLDLLDGESALFNSRFQLSSVQAVYTFAAYQLIASTGRLLETLGVAAPVEVKADHRLQSQKPLGIFNIEIEPLRQ